MSEYLGNTPTIARNSYIDPRVIDLYESGTTIDRDLVTKKFRTPAAKQRTLEAAVLDLLSGAIPNQDFFYLYGPGSLWVLAGIYKIFGTHILVERMVGLAGESFPHRTQQ